MTSDGASQVDETARSGSIGVVGAAAIGVGGMVGGGIFAVLGVAAEDAGGATPLAFLIGGVVAALTAVSYARLSVAMPSSGGTVSFVDRVFGVSIVTGSLNALLWIGYVVTSALYASAFGNYTATLFPGGNDPSPLLLRVLIAVGVVVPWLINLGNAAVVARAETWVVAVKIGILVVVIAAGAPSTSEGALAPSDWPAPLAIVAAGMLIFVAYEGFELIANSSDDVRRPRRSLPLAFGLAVGVVVVLYVAIAAVVVGSLSPDQIAESADFALAEAAAGPLGDVGFHLVAISAMLATLSALNATLYGASRLSYTLATEGELPERFENVRWNDPVGLHVTAALGLVAALALPIESISAVASAIFLAVFATVNVAAFRAAADANVNRPVAAAGAVSCCAALLVLVVDTIRTNPIAIVVLVGVTSAVMAVEWYVLADRRPAMNPTGSDRS
jgi:amino acid transporter